MPSRRASRTSRSCSASPGCSSCCSWSRRTGPRPPRPCSTPTTRCGSRSCADWLAGQGWYDLDRSRASPPRLRVALVAADRCRARRHALDLRPVRRCRACRAADAHRLADAVAAADHGGHRRDRLAHRRPRGRADRAAAGAGRACRRSTSSGPAASIITMCRSRSRCSWSPRPCGPTACAGRPSRRARVTGLALAIGLECLPYLVVCAAAFAAALRRRSRRRAGRGRLRPGARGVLARRLPRRSSSPAIGDAASATPSRSTGWRWCVAGGLGLVARRHAVRERPACRRGSRWAGATAALRPRLFVWIEPRCLAGPYAMMEPAVWAIWLAHVREMQPLVRADGRKPAHRDRDRDVPGGGAARRRRAAARSRPAPRFRLPGGEPPRCVAAFVTTLAAIKAYSYATWLGMPLVAAFALHLFAALRLHTLVPRFAVGLMLTPAALSIGAISIANAAGLHEPREPSRAPERAACLETANYAPLARLPAGPDRRRYRLRSVPAGADAAFDSGRALSSALRPGSLRRTRSSRRRRDAARACRAAPRRRLCGHLRTAAADDLAGPRLEASLWGRLQANDIPAWLERVADATAVPGLSREVVSES